jgi:hypothetical protein
MGCPSEYINYEENKGGVIMSLEAESESDHNELPINTTIKRPVKNL